MSGNTPPGPVVNAATTIEVARGVHVIPDGRVPLVPNIGVVVSDGAAMIVDCGMGPRNGEAVLAAARRLAPDHELTLTLTHFHPEHGYGAQVFAGQSRIVYNEAQRIELCAKGAGYAGLFRTFGDAVAEQLEGLELVEPDETYDSAVDLDMGRIHVLLRSWGPAHTAGDQVVFLPEQGVLFAGDLVENRMFPIFPYFPPDDTDVDGSRWIAVLERLEALQPTVVVPGHGEVGDVSLITTVRTYLEHVRDEVGRFARQGGEVDEAIAHLEPALRSQYPDWDGPEWIDFAIRSFYASA